MRMEMLVAGGEERGYEVFIYKGETSIDKRNI